MNSDRREFLKSATAAAVLTLTPLSGASATSVLTGPPVRRAGESVSDFERRMLRARPVALGKVRVTGGPLKHAQELTAAYLLSLDPDRMLAFYRVRAGLEQKAEPLPGWDAGGRNLTGHIAGHHLSAVSLMYEATGDARFKQRADYIVGELAVVQRKNGDGYVGALEGLREAFAAVSRGEIRSGGFDLNGLWSPWYTLHKTYAGLRDAWRHTGNAQALDVETKFAVWAEGVLAPMSHEQVQKMLNTEHGGMNEVFAELYADTGDERWLKLSRRFEHEAFTGPLKRHQDNLSGKHGNCQIPKLIGSAMRYGYTGDPGDIMAASFFWDRVVQHHTYASGGHGLSEYFGPPDELSARVDGRTCETCNVYNMIKLTRRLFSFRPDAAYADFQERALFNHILASIDPDGGATSYMVPVGRAEQQEYQDMQRSFTCCVGTGMESHALHGYGVWYESDDTIWANLFVPTTVETSLGRFAMDTGFPDGDTATIRVTQASPKAFTLAVRRPVWARDGFRIAVNGLAVEQPPLDSLYDPVAGGRAGALDNEAERRSGTYVSLTRAWKTGDTVTVTLPKSLHLDPTPDNANVTAIMWGPLALAADLGPRREEGRNAPPPPPVPVFVSESRRPEDLLASAGTPGDFRTQGITLLRDDGSRSPDLALAPFYRTQRRTYSLYVDLLTSAGFAAMRAADAAAREREAALEAATVGAVLPGDTDSERNTNYRSEPADRAAGRGPGRGPGRSNRAGAGWFSYDMPVDGASPMSLVVTYYNDPGLPAPLGDFAILVDGTRVASYAANQWASGFNHATYEVPDALTAGKGTVTVRFEAGMGGRIVPVYSVRTVRRPR